jgi:DNA-binding NtrC family response regulator
MKSVNGTVLVADDDPGILEVLRDRLESLNLKVFEATTGRETFDSLERYTPDILLLDIAIPDINGLEILKEIRRRGLSVTVVMLTAYGTVERAVSAMKEGAYDFITKPFDTNRVSLAVQKALEREQLKREVGFLSEELDERYRLVAGTSGKMQHAIEMAQKASQSRSTVLLLGESGTGKELFARAIHRWSERKDRPFSAINCVGLSKDLLESELFGHEKGAFTGADQLKKGKMELAHGGTVFLDEVGDVSTELQTKLLRFLQEREFERVGGTRTIPVDVRIIAATNQNLTEYVREGRFRQDLFYRLNVISITLPPLRERKEDIPMLARYFLQRYSKETKKHFTDITPEAVRELLTYDWPGNVRELANVIERAIVLGKVQKITIDDLPGRIAGDQSIRSAVTFSYHEAVSAAKKDLIQRTLAETKGNRAAAAKLMGVQRTYLARLIKNLGIR